MMVFSFICFLVNIFASRLHMLTKIDVDIEESGIKNIDAVFVINLDKRPERLKAIKSQFIPYGININRFKAVYGIGMSAEEISKAGLIYDSSMEVNHWATSFDDAYPYAKKYVFLNQDVENMPVFSQFASRGSVGCYLSHLSILNYAYGKGLNSVWILEDDAKVVSDPRKLEGLIDELTYQTSDNNWDVLYTDLDLVDQKFYYEKSDFFSGLRGLDLNRGWRPDMLPNKQKLLYRQQIGDNFVKIGSRFRTHSMIVSRSGMKKILAFFEQKGMYGAYDHDIHLVPDIQEYNLTFNLVTFEDTGVSDTGVN